MGLTSGCPNKGDKSCQVSCKDPQHSNQCVVLQAQLVDGSPCGYAGSCSSGKCNAGSLLDTAKAWYVQNLQISIPVTVAVGIVVLFLLYGLYRCVRRCCVGSRSHKSAEPALRAIPAQRISSWIGPPAPVPRNRPPSAPEQGVWIPPPGGFVPSNREYSARNVPPARSGNIPSVLRAGSEASLRSAPSMSTNNRAGYGAQDSRYPRVAPGHSRGGQGSFGSGAPPHWVDPSAWNGPPR